MTTPETHALLTLQLTQGLGVRRITRLVEQFGSATKTLRLTPAQLAQIDGIAPTAARRLRQALDDTITQKRADEELDRCDRAGVRLIARGTAEYPALLRDIPDSPPLLWAKGPLDADDRLALAIVGSRKCSTYGRTQAEHFAARCASLGLTIVSGGALGIDGAAHRAALQAGGTTLVVIGSGLERPYPAAHRHLFKDLIDSGRGTLLSELPLLTPPAAENFPRRNRIISGLALGTLVIEAGARSGAMITARLCVEEHGRELMAVPGPLDRGDSSGCHRAIREQWASLVTSPDEVLQQLAETRHSLLAQPIKTIEPPLLTTRPAAPPEPSTPARLKLDPLATLEGEPRTVAQHLTDPLTLDQLAERIDLPTARIQAAITILEIKGLLQRDQGRLSLRA
ncbi:MAG: DNA-processing protein DprA [Phycisphaeraceae bacterium]